MMSLVAALFEQNKTKRWLTDPLMHPLVHPKSLLVR